jgi:hypothetical protein
LIREQCGGIGCQPHEAFRGYDEEDGLKLAEAVSLVFHDMSNSMPYNLVTRENISVLRQYKYECNPSARGMWGERRFAGAFKSVPTGYLTVVGMRLISQELRVYRIARQYPFRNAGEMQSLAHSLQSEYGNRVLFVDYLSSNAYAEVIHLGKDGWFGRSTLFNPSDLSDNAAELVLIDPRTRPLLEPSSMPSSGEIKPLPLAIPRECHRSIPLR